MKRSCRPDLPQGFSRPALLSVRSACRERPVTAAACWSVSGRRSSMRSRKLRISSAPPLLTACREGASN